MKLKIVDGSFSIARYPAGAKIPSLQSRGFCSVTRTKDELSIVCETDLLPKGAIQRDDGWACLQVDGILDFDLTGIMSSLAVPLADAEVSLFAVSTFNTDYILVKKLLLEKARAALIKSGFQFS